MTKANSSKYYVICKDCGHSGAPRVRLSGKIYLLIPAVFVGIVLLLFNLAALVTGIATFVFIYVCMRVNTCAVCGSRNVDEVIPMAAIVAPGDSQRQEAGGPSSSTESFKPASAEVNSPKVGNNLLVACKECGNEISRKAEICPKCGFRYRPSAQPRSGPGFIVSLFKLVGGVVGAVIGLMVAVSFLSGGNRVSPTRIPDSSSNSLKPDHIFGSGGDSLTPARQLEIRCEEGSNTQPAGAERRAFYERCVATGSSVIRSQERINTEGSQATDMPVTPTRKLEIGCEEFSKSLSEGAEKSAEYQNCIASGLSVIKAQERINAEGSQAAIKPTAPAQAPIAPQAEGSTDRPIVTDASSSQADKSN